MSAEPTRPLDERLRTAVGIALVYPHLQPYADLVMEAAKALADLRIILERCEVYLPYGTEIKADTKRTLSLLDGATTEKRS